MGCFLSIFFSSTCQQFNIDQSSAKPSYIPTEGPKSLQPFANCSMDLITNLPLADRYVSILVVVDQGLLKGIILLSALKSGPVPVLGSSGLGPWTGPVLIFPNMEGPRTGPHKTGFTRSWAVLGPVLVKTDS